MNDGVPLALSSDYSHPLLKRRSGGRIQRRGLDFPSTSYLVALPWMTKAVRAQPELAESFAECARTAGIREIGKTRNLSVLNQLESETKTSIATGRQLVFISPIWKTIVTGRKITMILPCRRSFLPSSSCKVNQLVIFLPVTIVFQIGLIKTGSFQLQERTSFCF